MAPKRMTPEELETFYELVNGEWGEDDASDPIRNHIAALEAEIARLEAELDKALCSGNYA